MKICAACHEDLPKDSYSKKQLWKLVQRRCKVCIANNREVQPISTKQHNNDRNTNEIIKALDSMYLDAENKISDEELFRQPPPAEDCPICFLRMPSLQTGSRYQTCCGKMICSGCVYAPVYDNQGNKVDNEKCPFCRAPTPNTDEEIIEREKKRVEVNDPIATYDLGNNYRDGEDGYEHDYTKALELWHRAGELGYSEAYVCIGYSYDYGQCVEIDKKKANHYYELSAIEGNEVARCNLGNNEKKAGNMERALKHYMISARDGHADALKQTKKLYSNGDASKEDYMKALRAYQAYLGEIKSVQRDKAAAAREDYRYY